MSVIFDLPERAAGAWVTSWAAPVQPDWGSELPFPTRIPALAQGAMLKQRLRLSLGGEYLRLEFSNQYGHEPLTLGSATLCLANNPRQCVSVTFGGQQGVSIAPGQTRRSDPLALHCEPLSTLELALELPGPQRLRTFHWDARDTSHVESLTPSTTSPREATDARIALCAVHVEIAEPRGCIAVIGDSLVNGHGLAKDSHTCWVDRLAAQLAPAGVGVINAGQSGCRLLRNGLGVSVLERFERDVLDRPGVRWAIVQAGINDLGWSESVVDAAPLPTFDALVQGYRQLIEAAHARGIGIVATTLTPFKRAFADSPFAAFHSGEKDRLRHALNLWICQEADFDAVLDLDALVRDVQDPDCLADVFDSGDHLHPGEQGSALIARWVAAHPYITSCQEASVPGRHCSDVDV